MKTGKDFRQEFPELDPQFKEAAQRALQGLQDERVERRMKLRTIMVLALLLVLLTGVSVATTWERWSLDDFIPTERITATEGEWHEMLDSFDPVTVQTSVAEVTVRQALFDGYALYIVADARPKGESVFFVPEGSKMDEPASEVASSLPEDMTLQEYVDLNGYTRTFEVSLHTSAGGITFVPEMELNEDGTATFYLRQRMSQPMMQKEQALVTLYMSMYYSTVRNPYTAEVLLTIDQLPVVEEAISAAGDRHEFANSGVALSNLRLIRTPLSTYVTADAEITDEEAYQSRTGNFVINFASTDGERYDSGPFNLMGFMRDPVDREHVGPLYYAATLTLKKLPDAIIVMESPWGQYDPDMATDSWIVHLDIAN